MQIVSVLLLTLRDNDLVTATAERLSLHRIRDNMGVGLEPTLGYLRYATAPSSISSHAALTLRADRLVDRIVERADPDLYRVVNQCVGQAGRGYATMS